MHSLGLLFCSLRSGQGKVIQNMVSLNVCVNISVKGQVIFLSYVCKPVVSSNDGVYIFLNDLNLS